MNAAPRGGGWSAVSLRARFALLMAFALCPGLLLGLLEWVLFCQLAGARGAGPATWVWLAGLVLPLLAFGLSLGGMLLVANREILRWLPRLQGRGGVASEQGQPGRLAGAFDAAPPEVRQLAERLDDMASAIGARDSALSENSIQRDGLLREIHHRVKNNLQVISSLLNLQQRSLTDPAARAALSDTRQRIAALALIYRAVYEGADLRKVNLADFLEELIGQLIMTDTGQRPGIRTELAIDALTIDPDHLAPLALFAVEAITNAKKHGLTESGGKLAVVFSVRGAEAELAITDSGRAGSEAVVVGEGVGRTLMSAFARQLGGAVSFCPHPGGGLTAKLTFPTPRLAA